MVETFEDAVIRVGKELLALGQAAYGGVFVWDDECGYTHNGSDFYGSVRECMRAIDRGEGVFWPAEDPRQKRKDDMRAYTEGC